MNLAAYLNRIQYSITTVANLDTLVGLHRAHARTIPFENLDVIRKVPILLDQERIYTKIVETNRGGLCYEMNGLLKKVLDTLGFESWFISCNVYLPLTDTFTEDFRHVAIIARVEGDLYLLDVGFGDGFTEPLRLTYATPQVQYGTYYRLSALMGEEILLEKSVDGVQYSKMYKLTLIPRALREFEAMCLFHQTSPEAPFTRQPLCTRPTPDGRITLTGSSLIFTRYGVKQEVAIQSEKEFRDKLEEYFGMVLEWANPLAV